MTGASARTGVRPPSDHHVSTTACANPDLVVEVAPGLRCLSLEAAGRVLGVDLARQPRALRILAEDILFRLPGDAARPEIAALAGRETGGTVSFAPQRALLQDFMGVPLLTDMASLRDALAEAGGDPARLDPAIPVDFVVDHSLTVFFAGDAEARARNQRLEFERNAERFALIKWAQGAFGRMRVVPPGRGIMHQVNLEWLSHVVALHGPAGQETARPDTMIGTDSHTTMVNALGVLGWGVGGIEAEMAMLGVPLLFAPPRVVGIRLEGALRRGVTATDLVLHVTEFLRGLDVVGAFVEMVGPGLDRLSLADRATVANMAPEYGATCTLFPIDRQTIGYLRMTGRDETHLARIEAVARAQGLWHEPGADDGFAFDALHRFDLGTVEPAMAGPTRPEDRVPLHRVPASFADRLTVLGAEAQAAQPADTLDHGSVVLAAITSCTNTSNPSVMMAAGLLARNAVARGLRPKPWVKTSLSPGSRAVTDYLAAAGLDGPLDTLGFQLVGYGCATCNGNSGPFAPETAEAITARGLRTVGVLSGNRNFEGRIHPQIAAAYLASPPLVIAAALAGTVRIDLSREPLGHDAEGRPVTLAEIWPDDAEVANHVARFVTAEGYRAAYATGMDNTADWAGLAAPHGVRFPWSADSRFIRPSPFPMLGPAVDPSGPVRGARVLLALGDSITTDHISPNGAIRPDSPAGRWLLEAGETAARLGNFGARRGNADVCLRGMFDNPLLLNDLAGGRRGNVAPGPDGSLMSVFDAAMAHAAAGTPLVIVAGRNYGAGSSRDWAAKGLRLLGVVAVIAESFERIHRENLLGMGILPIRLPQGVARGVLARATGIDIVPPPQGLAPGAPVTLTVRGADGSTATLPAQVDVTAVAAIEMLTQGGMLPLIRRRLLASA